MIDLKQCAWQFVARRFGMRQSFFEVAWSIESSFETTKGPPGSNREPSRRLGIIGDEDDDGFRTVRVLAEASKRLSSDASTEAILSAIKDMSIQFSLQTHLLNELLEHVKSQEALRSEKRSPSHGYAQR